IGLVHTSYGCNINFTRDFESSKKALNKHVNPVPCEIYGELMKNIKGYQNCLTNIYFALKYR
ncbi:hypothetical protein BpHYR1_011605, partial [Brachionus plicatilis]